MKKILLTVAFLLIASIASAQVQFPLLLRAEWIPNPVGDTVDFYIVTIDGVANNIQAGTCTVTACTATFTITTAGPHTVSVAAANMFGSGLPASITFSAVAPGKSSNVKIVK